MAEQDKVWTIGKIIDQTKQYLAKHAVESPRLDAEILLCHILGKERIYLYVNFEQPLLKDEIDLYRSFIVRRAKGEPIAYILGKKHFFNLELIVNENVLIPRPETELLAEVILQFCQNKDQINLLDIGTGSGTLAVSITQNSPIVKATALDISDKALAVAKENAQKYQLENRIKFIQSDIFANLPESPENLFDVIVSNPPYIVAKEIDELAQEVKKEPRIALDGGTDGLDFYRKIIKEVKKYLLPTGLLAFEIGYNQAQEILDIAKKENFTKYKVIKDYAGLNRIVLLAGDEFVDENNIMAD